MEFALIRAEKGTRVHMARKVEDRWLPMCQSRPKQTIVIETSDLKSLFGESSHLWAKVDCNSCWMAGY